MKLSSAIVATALLLGSLASVAQQPAPALTGDAKPDTGWAIGPNTGRPLSAIFAIKSPIDCGPTGATLAFTLDHLAAQPQHTLGRFRLWVTSALGGAALPTSLPPEITAILKVPADKRNDELPLLLK